MKDSNKQPKDKKRKSGQKDIERSKAEFEEAGYQDQPADLSEGTAVAGRGNVSPGREGEVENPPSGGERGRMKGYETTDMPREPEQMKEYASGDRAQYLVTLSHSPEDCRKLHDAIEARGHDFADKWQWSCASGNHTGYALVEARNEDEALELVPEEFRDRARAVRAKKFTFEEVNSLRGKK